MYVVVIEFDNGEVDYKAFEKSSDAVKRYDIAYQSVGSEVRKNDDKIVRDCKMFKVITSDARAAVNLVKEGVAEPFEKQYSKRELEALDALMTLVLPPDDSKASFRPLKMAWRGGVLQCSMRGVRRV